jgi:pimeloyl-ACP methyl ester carboxylesterase
MIKYAGLVMSLIVMMSCSSEDRSGSPNRAVSGKVISGDGMEIAYTVAGDGPVAVVLIHGWACDRSYWSEQIGALAGTYRVVAVDLAGHGESDLRRERWTLEGLSDDVQAVVESLDLRRVVLVGHSMGGPVALGAVPPLRGRVAGVIGVDTLHNAEVMTPPEVWDFFVRSFESDFRRTCERYVGSLFFDDADPAVVARVKAGMCEAPRDVVISLMRDFPSFDYPSHLTAAGVPVRVINSALNPTAVDVNRKYADFDATVMKGVGHFPMLERPEEFNALLSGVIEDLVAP